MFSYRHAFHAGNHADVLKHAMLLHTLDHLGKKETPYSLIDTHAGAGIYDLSDDWARTKGESDLGVARVYHAAAQGAAPKLIQRYLEAVQTFNVPGSLRWYPGSPWLALHAMRSQDRLRLFEMHPAEADILTHNLSCLEAAQQRQTELREADGFSGLKALLPPPSRRGLSVIDPSYEDKQDYRRVLQMLEEGLKRFAHGSYFIWYPLVQRREVEAMLKGLRKLAPAEWLHASLQVCKPSADGIGLYGSGVFLINPPYTLAASLREALPWLTKTLAQDTHARHTLESGDNTQKKPAVEEEDEFALEPARAPSRPARPPASGAPKRKPQARQPSSKAPYKRSKPR